MYPPYGGQFIFDQVQALQRRGHQVDVVSILGRLPWPFTIWRRAIPNRSLIQEDGGRYWQHTILMPPTRRGLGITVWKLLHRPIRGWILSLTRDIRPDIVHAHVGTSPGYLAVKIMRHLGVPFVLTTHGQDTREAFHLRSWRKRTKQVFGAAPRVIAVSRKLVENTRALGIDTANMVVINNGTVPQSIREKSRYWTPDCGRRFRIVVVNNLVNLKAVDDTLRAVRMLVDRGYDVEFRIGGDGLERPKLQALTRELSLQDRVTFLGVLTHPLALEEIGGADVYCMPSWSETFGIAYLEALGQGVPAISAEGQGFAPFMKESGGGFTVPPHSPQAIADNIAWLIDHPDEAAAMGRRGHQYVKEGWTWDVNAANVEALYHEVIEEFQHRPDSSGSPWRQWHAQDN
jgi:glycosyltransferase involved in cell wall biosynthesis